MVENENQYWVTLQQLKIFIDAALELNKSADDEDGTHPILKKARFDAVHSQIASFVEELHLYNQNLYGDSKP